MRLFIDVPCTDYSIIYYSLFLQLPPLFERMLNNIESFRFSRTCVDVFLSNVLCINCHAQPRMCPGRCTEVFIGCVSPLSQSIAQLQTSFRLILCKTTVFDMVAYMIPVESVTESHAPPKVVQYTAQHIILCYTGVYLLT